MRTQEEVAASMQSMVDEAMKDPQMQRLAAVIGPLRAMTAISVLQLYAKANAEEREQMFKTLVVTEVQNPLSQITRFAQYLINDAPTLVRTMLERFLGEDDCPEHAKLVYRELLSNIPVGN